MKDQRVRANGITLRCRIDGPSSAPTILLSNSLATDLSMWDGQAAHLAQQYRVIRYDTRGHGESEASKPPYTLSMLAEDVRSLLDALGVGQVHYVGLSLGGMTGQVFAARYPHRLHSLALCDTSAKVSRSIWEERIRLALREGIECVVEPSVGRWFTKSFREREPAVIEAFRRKIRGTSIDGYLGCANAIMEMDNNDLLGRIATPTLVVVGRDDPATPVGDSEILKAGIAGSRLLVIDDAAHLPNIEREDEFNEVIGEFLSRQVERAQGVRA
jgi:3-oxoadipate enol-lactonase